MTLTTEKHEDCPKCGCTGAEFNYDGQDCGRCGWNGIGDGGQGLPLHMVAPDARNPDIARLEQRCEDLQTGLDAVARQRDRLQVQLDEARGTIDRAVAIALKKPTGKDLIMMPVIAECTCAPLPEPPDDNCPVHGEAKPMAVIPGGAEIPVPRHQVIRERLAEIGAPLPWRRASVDPARILDANGSIVLWIDADFDRFDSAACGEIAAAILERMPQ